MKKEQFIEFLEEHILPIFTGSEISGEEQSSPRDAQVAQGVGGSILAKFNKQDEYRIIIKRIQPFKTIEVSLVKSIIEELKELSQYTIKNEYIKKFQSYAIEKAICKAVSEKSSATLLELISEISVWSQRTYEGHYSSFGFIMSGKKLKDNNENLHFSSMLSRDFSALLSDGINTFLDISADGYLTGYTTASRTNDYDMLCPYEFSKIANITEGNKVGISLLVNGDILLFKDKMLVFAKKNGFWTSYSHEEIIHRLADKTKESGEDIRKAIYLTALDTSFSKSGGCLVHLNKENVKEALKHIDINDILLQEYYQMKIDESLNYSFLEDSKMQEQKNVNFEDFIKDEKCIKISNLRKIIGGRKFNELDRNLRQELVAIDGATVIDSDGDIIAVGAIIKIEAGSTGGGRLAATKTLSKYGVALKISADGSIEGYHFDKNRNKTKPLFFL